MRLFSYFTKKVRSKILNICFPVRFAKFLRTCLLRNTSRKQPPRGVPRKRCSENMQQIYKRTPMPNCDFNKVAKQRCKGTPLNGCFWPLEDCFWADIKIKTFAWSFVENKNYHYLKRLEFKSSTRTSVMLMLKKKLKKTAWIYEFLPIIIIHNRNCAQLGSQNTRFLKTATPYVLMQYAECDLLSHSLSCF